MSTEKEAFIPISRFALIEHLLQDAAPENRDAYARLLHRLAAWRHLQFRDQLLRLKERYLPFSPDRDTRRVRQYDAAQKRQLQNELINELETMLRHANYQPVLREDMERIFAAGSAYGLELQVDLSEFERVLLYSRGSGVETLYRRDPKTLFLRKKKIEVAIFQRLFLLLKLKPKAQRLEEIMAEHRISRKKAEKRLKKARERLPEQIDSDYIYLKTFKRIPQIDLEMLFPNTRIRLRPFDKIKLGVTAGGGTIGSAVGAATKFAAAANPLAAAGVLLGLAGVVFRQVKKFFTQKNKYMMVLAQKLYFHNLANNRGVLTLLTDRAEEEEIKENYLLYHALLKADEPQPLAVLKQRIEDELAETFGVNIDFDIDNAIQALTADGLVTRHADGRLSALPPARALPLIDEKWNDYSESPNAPQD
ncbi:MAG TPA: DUF3754 domain-containing protein [Gammaproteobacteria bacterium]|nr:DUF3754 domain-containing protein [Gammaproteobacteria bacterium]